MFKSDGTAKPYNTNNITAIRTTYDKHAPTKEMQQFYETRAKNNPAWRPKCLDCGTSRTMIKCKRSFYCAVCTTERTHSMILIHKGDPDGNK